MRHHARLRLGAGEGDRDTAAEEGETWVSIQLMLLTRYVCPFASFPSSIDLLLQLPRSKTVCGSHARLDANVHVEATKYERRSGRHWRRLDTKTRSVWTDTCTFQRGTEFVFWRTRRLEHLASASEERRGEEGRRTSYCANRSTHPSYVLSLHLIPFPSISSLTVVVIGFRSGVQAR
jgi:hypothetical protein